MANNVSRQRIPPPAAQSQPLGEGQLARQQIAEAEAERDRLRLENMTALGAVFNGIGQGLTFGYIDEIAAGLEATFMSPFSDKTFDAIYAEQLDEARGRLKTAEEKHPWLTLSGEIPGGLPTGLGLYKAGTAILKNAPRLARLMGIGAVEGGIYGSGVAGEGGKGEGAIRGAGYGAALGPAGAGIAHVGGKAVNLISPVFKNIFQTPKAEARRIVLQALERDQVTPAQAEQIMKELGSSAVLADILGGNVQGVARAVTGRPGKAKSISEKLLHGRQQGQQSRIIQAAGVDPNEVGTFRMNITQIIQNRKTQAAPYYRKAYETPLDPAQIRTFTITAGDGTEQQVSTSLNELLEVIPKSFNKRAKKLMRGDTELLEEIRKRFPDTPAGRAAAMKEFQNPGTNSLRFYDYLKRAIDENIGLQIRKGAKEEVRNLMGQKNRLLGYLDEASPDYRTGREMFAGEANIRGAVEYGRSLMSNKVDLSEAELAIEAMSVGERVLFRQGVIRGLIDKLESSPEMGNFAKNLIATKRMKELLRHAFPDQATFTKFIKTAMAESRFSYSRNHMTGGSPTAPRLAEAADLQKEVAVGQSLQSGDPFKIGLTVLRFLGGSDVSEDTLEATARILFSQDVPKSVVEEISKKATGLIPTLGIVSAAVVGEKVREDVGGAPSVLQVPESQVPESQVPDVLFQ